MSLFHICKLSVGCTCNATTINNTVYGMYGGGGGGGGGQGAALWQVILDFQICANNIL